MSDVAGHDADLGRRVAALSPSQRVLLERRLAMSRERGIMRRDDPDRPAQLSFGQELLWLIERSTPESVAYNVPIIFSLDGPVNPILVRHTLSELVKRHDVFRTTFDTSNGEPVALTASEASPAFEAVDVTQSGDPSHALEEAIAERVRRPFDLAADPPFRATLFRIAHDRYVLLVLTHHIAFDGLSTRILHHEIAEVYGSLARGEQSAERPGELDYRDFAAWQRLRLTGERLERLLGYWRSTLAGAAPLELPTDRPRSQLQTFDGAEETLAMPSGAASRLRGVARDNGATPYMIVAAAFATVLHRYSGNDDIVIGSPVAARTRPETENIIGYFANILPLRIDVSADPPFTTLLGRVREAALGALDYQDVPLEKLILDLRAGEIADTALFRCVLTMQDVETPEIQAEGVTIRLRAAQPDLARTSKFDMVLLVTQEAGALQFTLQYRTELFDAGTARRLLDHLRTVLDGIVADPSSRISRLPLLSAAERTHIETINRTATAEPFRSVIAAFDAAARRRPDAVALAFEDGSLTYAETRARAAELARRLSAAGAGPGTIVGLCLDVSAEAIVALLAILQTGAAYLPVPPDSGQERIAKQFADAAVTIVVTAQTHLPVLPGGGVPIFGGEREGSTGSFEAIEPAAADLAYVLYTSGSSGEPKGVAVTHGNLANYAHGILRVLDDDPGGGEPCVSFATVTTLGADLGNTAIFGALTSGGTLHVLSSAVATDAERLAAYSTRHAIDVLKITPSHLAALIGALGERAATILPRRALVLGGEALGWPLVDTVRTLASVRIINHYGPTETTVGSAVFSIDPAAPRVGATVPIGRPLANVALHVLDVNRADVPIGVPGELFVSGLGVARGYLGRERETAERFIELDGIGRSYRTGDRVRRLASGDIEFIGRLDRQIKLHGFRIEPGEIEALLAQHPDVDAAVVMQSKRHEGQLVAFLAVPDAKPTEAARRAIAEWLGGRLPPHMVPARLVVRSTLPLNANGKIDIRGLTDDDDDAANSGAYVAPRTNTEATIAAVWADVLKRDRVAVTDDFFAIGGDSLLAIRALGRLSRRLGMRIPLRALFEAPTLEKLAEFLAQPETLASLHLPYLAFNTSASAQPFFFMHGDLAGCGLYSAKLAEHLGDDRPFYAFHPAGMLGDEMPNSIEGVAAAHVDQITAIQPAGPYSIGGYCNGGIVAFEIAQQLRARGDDVRDLVMVSATGMNTRFAPVDSALRRFAAVARVHPDRIGRASIVHVLSRIDDLWQRAAAAYPAMPARIAYLVRRALRYIRRAVRRARHRSAASSAGVPRQTGGDRIEEWMRLRMRYVPRRYAGDVVHIVGADEDASVAAYTKGWAAVAARLQIRPTAGSHSTYLTQYPEELGASIQAALTRDSSR